MSPVFLGETYIQHNTNKKCIWFKKGLLKNSKTYILIKILNNLPTYKVLINNWEKQSYYVFGINDLKEMVSI